jgi:hypothetical protein
MKTVKFYRTMLIIQGFYTLVTALWAIIDIDCFMKVTGPKTDIWLVKTVAVILSGIGICLLVATKDSKINFPVIILAMTAAAGLAAIDFYYTSTGTISWIYRVDGILELLFVILWLNILAWAKKLKE